jgi:hypothetical protein
LVFVASGVLTAIVCVASVIRGFGDGDYDVWIWPSVVGLGVAAVACFRVARLYRTPHHSRSEERRQIDPFSSAGGWSD